MFWYYVAVAVAAAGTTLLGVWLWDRWRDWRQARAVAVKAARHDANTAALDAAVEAREVSDDAIENALDTAADVSLFEFLRPPQVGGGEAAED